MKKILIPALALAMILSAGAAFARGKAHHKAARAAVKSGNVECSLDGQKFMVPTLEACMHKGGVVTNYPGPNGGEPTISPEKAHAKRLHHKRAKAAQ